MPGGQVGWVGLQDFLNEGTFTWADGASLGSYTNWANNQPDNNGQGQVRVGSRVTCDVSRGSPSHLPSQELDWEATSANIKHEKFH